MARPFEFEATVHRTIKCDVDELIADFGQELIEDGVDLKSTTEVVRRCWQEQGGAKSGYFTVVVDDEEVNL